MGVAGSGKTTLAMALAAALGRPFLDGDDLHSQRSREKMAAGEPLSDDDRWPWLDRLGERLSLGDGVVIACSALKRSYRERLRGHAPIDLIYCQIEEALALKRLLARKGHYFNPSLSPSQFAALEPPDADESALTVDASIPTEHAVSVATAWVRGRAP
jgi:gluconokinase